MQEQVIRIIDGQVGILNAEGPLSTDFHILDGNITILEGGWNSDLQVMERGRVIGDVQEDLTQFRIGESGVGISVEKEDPAALVRPVLKRTRGEIRQKGGILQNKFV